MKRCIAIIQATLLAAAIILAGKTMHAGDEVLITSNRDGNAEIYLVELGGKTQTNLTNDDAEDTYPAWSPDGKTIAFASNRGGNGTNIFVMDADGKNVKPVTKHKRKLAYCATWSPDGHQIAYHLTDPPAYNLMVFDLKKGTERQLVKDAFDPAWSPDGKKIAYTKYFRPGFGIHVMDSDGTNETDLGTSTNQFGWSYPAWSPDGKKLAYSNSTGQAIELFVSDADGKNEAQITNIGGHNSYVAWAPDGKRILFRQTRLGQANKADAVWPFYWIDPESLNLQLIEELKDEPPLNQDLNPGHPSFRPKKPAAAKS